jgi:hypothetical protein
MADSTNPGANSNPPSGEAAALSFLKFFVGRIFELLFRALESKNVFAGLVALVVMVLGWVRLLPPEQRIKASPAVVAESIAEILGHGLLTFGGWLLSVILLTVAGGMFWLQHKRIQSQGRLIIKLRERQDPDRLSAGDAGKLTDYPQESEKKFRVDIAATKPRGGNDG